MKLNPFSVNLQMSPGHCLVMRKIKVWPRTCAGKLPRVSCGETHTARVTTYSVSRSPEPVPGADTPVTAAAAQWVQADGPSTWGQTVTEMVGVLIPLTTEVSDHPGRQHGN